MNIMTPEGESRAETMLRRAHGQYARLSVLLDEAQNRLQEDLEGADPKEISALISSHFKSFQSTFELEVKLEKCIQERAGIVNGYAVDLDAARTEIGRRLACLKNAR